MFAIGFKGGNELAKSEFTNEIFFIILLGLIFAALVPIYTFYILKRKVSISDAGAVSAAYGSVSAVTFVAAVTFLEAQSIDYGGHMVAVMALMEAPAIIIGVILMMRYDKSDTKKSSLKDVIHHSFTNGSVLLILGSLLIGLIADFKQAEGIKPFTNDIFKGFLAIFLLEMGMVTAKRFSAFSKYGLFLSFFAIIIPLINGILGGLATILVTDHIGDRMIFATLVASASYIAVPAAMRIVAPKADPGLYIPMALGLTFPFNITIGIPLYYYLVSSF